MAWARGRALRRYNRERVRKKRRDYFAVRWAYDTNNVTAIGILSETPKRYHYIVYGNPRRHFGKVTRKERLARMQFREALETLGE